MDLSVFFAGTGGTLPTPGRGLPALLVRRGGDRILVDCGEGTQRQLMRSVGLLELSEIYLTHLHTDHWLGLPGLLKTFDLRGREQPLDVHGPRGLRDLLTTVMRYTGRTKYELRIIELEPDEIVEHDGYEIAVVPVLHRTTAFAYVLDEHDRPGVFDPVAARAAGIADGPDFGRLQRGETVHGVAPERVMGPARPGRKVTLSGDTAPCAALRDAAHGSDLLVHEATFAIEDAEMAHERAHSTAAQAAGIARDAEVRLLALTHTSVRYPGRVLREEASEIFPATVLPRDFDTIEIPLAERGEPTLIRWERGAPAQPEIVTAPTPSRSG